MLRGCMTPAVGVGGWLTDCYLTVQYLAMLRAAGLQQWVWEGNCLIVSWLLSTWQCCGLLDPSNGCGRVIDWLFFDCSVPGNAAGCRTPAVGLGRWLTDCSLTVQYLAMLRAAGPQQWVWEDDWLIVVWLFSTGPQQWVWEDDWLIVIWLFSTWQCCGLQDFSSGCGRVIDWLFLDCSVPGNSAGCWTPAVGVGG